MKSEARTGSVVRLAVVLAACAGGVATVNAQSINQQFNQSLNRAQTTSLAWSTGQVDSVAPMSAMQIRDAVTELAGRADQRRVVVHLAYQMDNNQKQALKNSGLHLLTALGGTSYFATLEQGADAAAISRSAVASISEIHNTQKMHADIQGGIIHSWMISSEDVSKSVELQRFQASGIMTVSELQEKNLEPAVALIVMFHTDTDRLAESARIAQELGGKVRSDTVSTNSVVMTVKPSQMRLIAEDDAVMWVEPPMPQLEELNSSNRALVGADTLSSLPYSLDGSGVTVLVFDGGRMFQHNDFGSRLTIGASDTAGISDHATHVGGTIGGDGTGNLNNRGMAPGVDIISYGFEQPGGLMQGFLYTDPGDIEADYTEAINTYGAEISNNSIGTNTAPNGYPCDWTGNYGNTSALIDSIVRGSVGDPFRVVWANGNERQSSRCVGDDNGNHGEFYSTAPPSCAKNHITVGSVDSDTDLTSSFSSWGPTDDGRLKPDISAPGCQAGGDGGVTSTSSSGGYNVKCGTSMAAPTVTGVSALIMEQYGITFPDRPMMMNATLKSILANSAEDRGNVGPDFKYGYGSIRGVDAIDTVIAENVIESEVAQGGTYRGIIIVGPGEDELKVTVAWDDAPAAPNVNLALVNDLDIRLIDTNGNAHLPWTLDPSNPNGAAVQSAADHLNNIEQVSISNPAPGAYTVEVTGFNIADGVTQTFGLTSSTTLINCSSAGIIGMGGNLFSCEGETTVQVVDCDLNTSDTIVDTVDVMVESTTDLGGPLMLTLVETAPESATFTGTFTYADTMGSADIVVAEGGTLSATYIDLDDGEGNTNVMVEATASIDCTPAMLIAAAATNIEPRSADASVDLDEDAKITVHYGTSMFSLNDSVSSGSFSMDHLVSMSGLTDETTYFFTVDMEDRAGNTSSDDNGGAGYTFTTPDIPDFFTEEFGSGLDLEGLSLTFVPNGEVDGYDASIEPLEGGVLPFEPTDGSFISLSDDDSELVNVTGGNMVQLYGQSYNSVYVGSNGYLTFGASDTDYTESFADHFDTPRISGLYDDLNPSSSGTVYAQQLADRLVISYDGVTEYSGSNQNTFQFELHFDGTIVISWERIDSSDAICGLSEGQGEDPDFVESDLSSYPAPNNCPADITGDGVLNFFDVSAFISAFGAEDPIADINGDGSYNFFDVSAFITLFTAGCP